MARSIQHWSRRALFTRVLPSCLLAPRLPLAFGANGNASSVISKPIPASAELLPAIGLGTDAFNRSDQAAIREEIERIVQLGGTVIDTSSDYGDSEALIGDALSATGLRSRLFLATKLTASGGLFGMGIGGEASFRRSLQRLRTDRVDLLQVHNLDGTDTLMPLMQRWKQAGQTRYVGVTVSVGWQHDALARTMRRYPLDFIQVDYSIDDRDAERVIFPTALERGVAVLVNLPLGRASLIRRARGKPLPPWAAELGISSWSQFFLKYVISHPAVTCAIPGSTQVAHLQDNQLAAREPLPDAAARARMERYWGSL
jgi:aryl-alcohol dehydrogenase-like predicted oxidoreductase